MNIPNILALADHLELPEVAPHFYMDEMLDPGGDLSESPGDKTLVEAMKDCGSVACICGWATALAYPDTLDWQNMDVSSVGRDWLGLTSADAASLFFPADNTLYHSLTAVGAAKALRHLAKTGEVDFRPAFED